MKRHRTISHILIALLLLAFGLAACGPAATQPPAPTTAPTQAQVSEPTTASIAEPAVQDLILATTTSTQDSGLLDVLIPLFEDQTGYVVKTVAVGTGQALKMGEEGNADVLLVHAPASAV